MVIFNNRREAGEVLAERLVSEKTKFKNPLVLGIPRGGIPIGYAVAEALVCPLDTILLRKLPIPDNPEAGFGAVTLDKIAILNEDLLSGLYLTKKQVSEIIDGVYKEVLRRDKVYRKGKPFPDLRGRSVILTDDGLASGYTMLAAIEFCRKREGRDVTVAVPVAHRQAYELAKGKSDRILALYISDLPYFAVASFYAEFPDISDEEVTGYLWPKKY